MRVKYTVRPMDPIHHPDKTEVVEPQLVGREQQPPEDVFCWLWSSDQRISTNKNEREFPDSQHEQKNTHIKWP